jgi:hypothetical protein
MRVGRGKECSFLKKRTKKLLFLGVSLPDKPATAIQKFFASFFQKRSAFFYPPKTPRTRSQ